MSYDLNSLQSDIGHLEHLIDTAVDTIMDCDFGPPEARVPHMDRLAALLWIARDLSEQLRIHVDANFEIIGRTCHRKAE